MASSDTQGEQERDTEAKACATGSAGKGRGRSWSCKEPLQGCRRDLSDLRTFL